MYKRPYSHQTTGRHMCHTCKDTAQVVESISQSTWHHLCTFDAHSLAFKKFIIKNQKYVTIFTRTQMSRDWWGTALSVEISNVLKNSKFDDLSVMALLTISFIHGDLGSRTFLPDRKVVFVRSWGKLHISYSCTNVLLLQYSNAIRVICLGLFSR